MARDLRRQGVAEVVLQWSGHGEHEFWSGPATAPGRTAPSGVARGVARLQRAGLRIVHGLWLGDDFFQAIQHDDASLARHLDASAARSLDAARRLARRPPPAFAGWYLPQEIDDLHWQGEARQRLLGRWLANMGQALRTLAPGAPVYVSAFFSGATPPAAFAAQLARWRAESGITWIVQDGQGTSRLPSARTAEYLHAIASGLPPEAWRGLLEVFDELPVAGPWGFPASSARVIDARERLWCSATGRRPEVLFSLNQQMAPGPVRTADAR